MSSSPGYKSLCPICASDTFAFVVENGDQTLRDASSASATGSSAPIPRAAFECQEGCKISVEGVEPVRRLRHLVMWSAA